MSNALYELELDREQVLLNWATVNAIQDLETMYKNKSKREYLNKK